MLGMKAIGEIGSLEAAGDMVGISHRHQPNTANAQTYAQLMEMFVRLYERLEPEFEALDRLDLPSGNSR
jgi:gluconokinase